MAYNEVQKRAVKKYNAKAYDELKIRVKKGRKEEIQDFAKAQGKSLNSFIIEVVDDTMKRGVRLQQESLNGSRETL